MLLVIAYLSAVVLANLTITQLGPSAAIPVAFIFIGLDLTSRDALHERWRGHQLWPRMALLIGAGGLISFMLNADAARVAVASTVAFVAAGVVDAISYKVLGERSQRIRVNGSNVFSAAVDSLVFPLLAFGALLPFIIVGQWLAKVVGGAIWLEGIRAVSQWRVQRGSGPDGHTRHEAKSS